MTPADLNMPTAVLEYGTAVKANAKASGTDAKEVEANDKPPAVNTKEVGANDKDVEANARTFWANDKTVVTIDKTPGEFGKEF